MLVDVEGRVVGGRVRRDLTVAMEVVGGRVRVVTGREVSEWWEG